jgi:predicted phosphodiesterase
MQNSSTPFTFGVIADTHIPDRAKHLPSMVLRTFERAQVNQILHAGDATNWEVIH